MVLGGLQNSIRIIVVLFTIINHSFAQEVDQMGLGDTLVMEAFEVIDDNIYILSSSGKFEKGLIVKKEGIIINVVLDSTSKITFLKIEDSNFSTPEGIKVGDYFSDIHSISMSKVVFEPGWAKYVQLESGWFAAFTYGDDVELSKTKVVFLFKKDW